MRLFYAVGVVFMLVLYGCGASNGKSCTVADNGDGTKTISCEDGASVTVSDGVDGTNGTDGTNGMDGNDGTDGTDGSSCSVVDNGDGTKTISCTDGTSVTLSDGADGADGTDGTDGVDGVDGTNCTVADNGESVTVSCSDGTSVTWKKGYIPGVLNFDDAYAIYGTGASPEWYYGTFGVHFDNTAGLGLIGGVGNGDLGNWDIEGTNGSAAWGLWGGTHSISFDTPTIGLSMDFLRGFVDVTNLPVKAYLNGTLVETQTFSLTGAFDSATVTFNSKLDKIEWTSTLIFGLDNVHYWYYE
jgi:hypothetical protein